MAKKALVTGASSGIGKAICKMLIEEGWEVYGIGRKFFYDSTPVSPLFHQTVLDLLSPDAENTVKEIIAGHDFGLLVNNAGVGFYGLHEEISTASIRAMVRTNLEIPMILTQLMLRDLKANHGRIINISSVTAFESNPHGAAYGATKAGLRSFAVSLFDEARKYGVGVTTILPDMTKTELYRNTNFTVDSAEPLAFLEPNQVAGCVKYAINCPDNMVVTEMTIKPLLKRIKRIPAQNA